MGNPCTRLHELWTAAKIETFLPMVGVPCGLEYKWSGGEHCTVAIPEGRPAPFDSFKVVATPALWDWWRADCPNLLVDAEKGPLGFSTPPPMQ